MFLIVFFVPPSAHGLRPSLGFPVSATRLGNGVARWWINS